MAVREARHLFLFSLLILSPLAFAEGASSFSECYPDWPLREFWSSYFFQHNNPYISPIPAAGYLYWPQFDASGQGIGIGGLNLLGRPYFESGMPLWQRTELSDAGKAIDGMQSSLREASEASSRAHSIYLSAQPVFQKYTDRLHLAQLFAQFMLYPASAGAELAADMAKLLPYVENYSDAYSEILQAASATYGSAQASALAVAKQADEEYLFLSVAGAGSENYSGAAKDAYFSAREYLSDAGHCRQDLESAYKIAEYFDSVPDLPDFAATGFPEHLQRIAGETGGSSIMQLAGQHANLKAAHDAMQGEYSAAHGAAQKSKERLASAVQSLGNEQLELIGDVPAEAGGKVLVGSSYSGILSGYARLQEDLKATDDYLADSQSAYAGKTRQDYLADAINFAKASSAVSENALASSELIRASAQAAVVSQGRLAEKKIAEAEAKAAALPSSQQAMQARQQAESLIKKAKDSFNSAASARTLGSKFAAYRDALFSAADAIEAAGGTYEITLRQEMESSLASLSSFLQLAQSDGLDVEYEKETLSEYRKIASGGLSEDGMQAVISAVQGLQKGVLLRLREKYSHLDYDFAEAASGMTEFRKQDGSFLKPEFESLSAYFPSGHLDVLSAAGHLSQISAQLQHIASEQQKRAPSYLSYLLSKNARLHELAQTPMLGEETDYSATIYTENTGGVSTDSQVSFSVKSEVPLYSSDFSGGDEIDDAYPEKGGTTILLPSVAAGARLSFHFEKTESTAQITSLSAECSEATEEEARVGAKASFFATRQLPLLLVQQPSPPYVSDASAVYLGRRFPLSLSHSAQGAVLSGSLSGVKSGPNTAEFLYTVRQPFSVSPGERAYEMQLGGGKKASFELTADAVIDCDSALVFIEEPFAASSFSVFSLGTQKVSQIKAAESGGSTRLSFVFSPLRKGKGAAFSVSYVISDPQSALASSLAAAQQQADYYNRTKDNVALEQAKLLASQNRTDEALAVLSAMLKEGQQLSYSYADYSQFQQEKSDAESLAEEAEGMVQQLSDERKDAAASQLSTIPSKLRASISSSSADAESKGYLPALQSLRKAAGDFRSSLASLAWKAASDAQDDYAKARKKGAQGLEAAEQKIADALRLYTKGEYLQSFHSSSSALQMLLQSSSAALEQDEADKQSAETLRADFALLQKQTEELLSKYAAQYSALSGASKKQLPLTPSEAQKKLDDAQKALSASAKSTLSPQQSLSAANASLAQLQSAYESIQSSYSSLQSSAESSLGVAKIALAEVKSKATEVDLQDVAQIEAEVSKAQGFLSSSLYADSLLSSERAIKAANAFLAAKGTGAPDAKTLLLAALSLVFLCIAAYYFITRARHQQKKEKLKLPKAE